MTDAELLERARTLQLEATRVMERLDLSNRVAMISKPELVGSAKTGLMVTKDIDVHAWMETPNIRRVAGLLSEFAQMPTVQKVQFNNYRELRRDHRKDRIEFPYGYYVGLRSVESSGEWKIDIWFASRGDAGRFDESKLDNLTDEQRLAILRLKELWRIEKGYRGGVLSVDIYNAVLDHGIRTAAEFETHLAQKAP